MESGSVPHPKPSLTRHHILRLVIDSAQAHLRRHLDCGWLYLHLALRIALVLSGLGYAQMVFARPAALHGLALASAWIHEELQKEQSPCRRHLRWSDLNSVLALLQGSLCKPVALANPRAARHLAILLLNAFLQALPAKADGPGHLSEEEDEAEIRFSWFVGPSITWSSCLNGLLLDTPAAVPAVMVPHRHGQDLLVVLFDVSLEQWLPTGPEKTSSTSSGPSPLGTDHYSVETVLSIDQHRDALRGLRAWEMQQFRRLAKELIAARVAVLACQKLVDPWLSDHLRLNGIAVLSRLSLRHIDHVRRLSGAVPVTSLALLPSDWSSVCGVVSAVELRVIQQREYIVLEPPVGLPPRLQAPTPQRISTVLVGAPDEHCEAELKRCLPQAVHSLRLVASNGRVLVGSGLTELCLAEVIQARAKHLLSEQTSMAPVCRAAIAIADCFKDVAASLPPSTASSTCSGGPPTRRSESLDQMAEALRTLQEASGGDGSLLEELPGLVLEAELPKKQAIIGALNLAGILVRLGGVLDRASLTLG